ncbi:MAG: (2Fe-2S)-binding protein [Xanthobacteraceae bacterium]
MKNLVPLTLQINGETHDLLVPPWRTLLEVLRENVGLTGAKRSCQEGQCGACTVLVDGLAVNSCMYLAIEAEGRQVQTIESLAQGGELDQIQKSFVQKGGIQCGFCTPGFVMATKALLAENPDPSEDEIRNAMVGHLCRCTGYVQIIEAIEDAADRLRAAGGRNV